MLSPTETVFEEIRKIKDRYTELPDRFLAVDTETTGTRLHHGHKPFAVSACNQEGTTYFWRAPVDPKTREPQWKLKQLQEIQTLITYYQVIVFHNAKFDIRALSKLPQLKKLTEFLTADNWSKVRDTLLYSHVADSQEKHGLKELAAKYVGIPKDDEDALQKAVVAARRGNKKAGYVNAEEVGWDYWLAGKELESYSIKDAVRTALLFAMYVEVTRERSELQSVEKDASWQVAREHLLLPESYAMEERGIRLRKTTLAKERIRFRSLGESKAKEVQTIAVKNGLKEFNPRSSPQLQKLLFEKWKLPASKETKTGFSTDADTLDDLVTYCSLQRKKQAAQFLESLLLSRKADKACGYLDEYESLAIPEPGLLLPDGKPVYIIHPSLNQTGTHTTRFAGSSPNPMNVSVDEDFPLREVYGPRPDHYWLDADYDNLEMRLFAYACGEDELIAAFEAGESAHLIICEELHGPKEQWPNLNVKNWKKSPEYKSTKNGNFSLIYGAGPYRANATYGVPDAYNRIRKRFKKLDAFMQEGLDLVRETGYVETMFSYRLMVPMDRAYSWLNYKIQGTAGCVLKYAILGLNRLLDSTLGYVSLPVHDELITEFHKSVDPIVAGRLIKQAMEDPGRMIGIPLPVSVDLVKTKWTSPIELNLAV